MGSPEEVAAFSSRPPVVGFDVRSEPIWVDASKVGLAEVKRPLNPIMASLAERRQIPRQDVPFVAVEMMNREHGGRRSVLGAAKFAVPAGASSDPS